MDLLSQLSESINLIVCPAGVDCDFQSLMQLVRNLINFLIYISTFLAAIVFAWAGFTLLTSGGNTGAKDKAKTMFTKVLIGYLWILAAWVVVYTITSVLLRQGYSLLQ